MNGKILSVLVVATLLTLPAAGALANDSDRRDADGAVYTMTNAPEGNAVVIFDRAANGLLTEVGTVATEGSGSGGELDQLASQGSLVLGDDHRWLLAVNAGSDEISVFRVRHDGPHLVDKADSGGPFPVSLAFDRDLVYVLNAGEPANITGFHLTNRGRLIPIEESTRPLGSGGFSQVGFDRRGTKLVITDRANHEILVYGVGDGDRPSMDPVTSPSSGLGPFAFIFDRLGRLLVAEAGSGAVSSYRILRDGELKVLSPSVANGETATCWIAGTSRGEVFTANTGSQTVSQYRVGRGLGGLMLIDETAGFANRPLDMDIANGRFLYALDPADGAVHMFRIDRAGGLSDLGAAPSAEIAIFAQGMAAR
jgi:6-phosphogluconolactonase